MDWDDDNKLLPAPLNAVGAPPGADRKDGRPGAGTLVLARMVWPSKVTIIPAIADWFSSDRTCIEWRQRPHSRARHTWLPKQDVRTALVYPKR